MASRETPPPASGRRGARGAALAATLLAAALAAPPAAGQRIDEALPTRPLAGLRPDRAALLLSGHDGGPVASAALAVPLPARGDDSVIRVAGGVEPVPVALFFEVDGLGLLGGEPPPEPRIELYAYAVDEGGAVRGYLARGLDLDLGVAGEALAAGGLRLVGRLALPPGRYSLRVLALESDSGRYAMRALPLEVPAPGAPWLSPPLVTGAGTWVTAAALDGPASELPSPAGGGGEPAAALPLLGGDEPPAVELLAAGLPPGTLAATARLTLPGHQPRTVEATVERRPAESGGERLLVSLPVSDLPPGGYALEVTVGPAAGGGSWDSPPLQVALLGATPPAEIGNWTALARASRGEAPPPTLTLDRGRREGRRADARRHRAVAAAYREALARFPEAGERQALDAVAGVERQAAAAEGGDGVALLTDGEAAVLDELAAADPEALVPVMRLHLLLYRDRIAARDFYLAVHSRQMAERAALLYADRAADPAADLLTARVLTGLGTELQKAHMASKGRELLAVAARLDPRATSPLLAMAAGHEKYGHYREAVAYLRRLVEIDPKSAEGRLRLAINLMRTGSAADGRAILHRLLTEANPPWVLSLAYQQLARERLDAGDAAGAADLLQQAVDRLPGDPRLGLAYAFALDRLGEPERASLQIARLDGGSHPGESPRYLYNEWPDEGTAEVEALLETSTRVRLPRLAAALAAGGAE